MRLLGAGEVLLPAAATALERLEVEVEERDEAVEGMRRRVFSCLRRSPGLPGLIVEGGMTIVRGICF